MSESSQRCGRDVSERIVRLHSEGEWREQIGEGERDERSVR